LNSLDRTVVKIDAKAAKVEKRMKLGFNPEGVAVGAGSVWVTLHSG
jgi:hypothetical protein